MAIFNMTPDSFSGDGFGMRMEEAVRRAIRAVDEGADIIDGGGESTRPGHEPVPDDEEISRIEQVISAIASAVNVPISIDTSKSRVAIAAIEAGASIMNDVRGLTGDPEMAGVAARSGLPVVIMHDAVPEPGVDLVLSVRRELERRIDFALTSGVRTDQIIIDPGFGFGKEWRQNLELLRRLPELKETGFPLLVGFSRKSTIGEVLDLPVEDRLEGTLATTSLAIAGGADIVRVHDVRPNVRVARMTDAVVRSKS